MKLKGCPFCGHEKATTGQAMDYQWFVECYRPCGGSIGYFKTRALAVKAWNKRPEMGDV